MESIKKKMMSIKQEKQNAELRAEQSEEKQKDLENKLQAVNYKHFFALTTVSITLDFIDCPWNKTQFT